jgi:hypothetical protein
MTTFADVARAVQATLASKRLGKPVFVRLTWQGLDKPEAITPRLARGIAVVQQWLGQPLEQVYALGSTENGQLALTLRFREGATALVSFTRGQPRGAGLDLLVLGNHGAIYHDSGSAELWDEPAADLPDKPDPALVALIEQAVRSRQPEAAGRGARP